MYSKSQSKQHLSEAHFYQPFYINKIQRLLNLNVESVGFCPSGAWTHHKDSLIVESHSQDAKFGVGWIFSISQFVTAQ